MIECAEHNARLLIEIKEALGATGIGHIHGFFETHTTWRCPSCQRSKAEFARVDRNGRLLCSMHRHHDHFDTKVDEMLRPPKSGAVPDSRYSALRSSFMRFDYVLICNDCNVAEPVAKKLVGAPAYFTFAPHEIAHFIIVKGNAGHMVHPDRAQEAYEAAKPSMKLLAARLKEMADSIDKPAIADFEHAGVFLSRAISKISTKGDT